MIKHVLIQAHSTTFLFIYLPIWTNTPLLLLFVRSNVSGKSRITQTIRVQVCWTKIYLYISLLMLHNCQTSGRWFPTKTVHLPLTRRGMWEVCTVCYPGSAIVERHSSWYQYNTNSRLKNPSFQTAPPLKTKHIFTLSHPLIFFLKLVLFLLISTIFCTAWVCTIKFFRVTSCKGQTTRGVKGYAGHVNVYFPN